MSEWLKEHDWKSCDGGESSRGSNPRLCAMKTAVDYYPPLFSYYQAKSGHLRGDKLISVPFHAWRYAQVGGSLPADSTSPVGCRSCDAPKRKIPVSAPSGT